MEKAIIGKKVGMTQIFDADGKVVPVTVIEAGPCSVVQKKTAEKDGYEAVQLGFMPTTDKHLTRGQKGHLAKAGVGNLKVLKEFKLDNYESLNVGDELKADTFAIGDRIDVTGISKGKGFAGVIKRHGAHRTPMSHGGGTQAPWAPPLRLPVSGRVRSAPARWATNRSPFRTWKSSRSILRST